jgi:hypothetical protein
METITLLSCQICGSHMSVEQVNRNFPPKGEKCFYCDRIVCISCVDWEYMMEKRLAEAVCKNCAERRKE